MKKTKPTLVLHFGLLSDETELIEDFFSLNYDKLIAAGIMYPTCLNGDYDQSITHQQLIEYLIRATRFNDLEDFIKAINQLSLKADNCNAQILYISSDSLIQLSLKELTLLVNALEVHFEVTALLFLRNHHSYLQMLYKQFTLDGLLLETTDFIKRYSIDYFSKTSSLVKLFGHSHIKLNVYDDFNSPIEYLRQVLPENLNAELSDAVNKYSPSYYSVEISAEEAQLIQILNQQTQSKHSNEIKRYFKRYKKVTFHSPSANTLFSASDIELINEKSKISDENTRQSFFKVRSRLFSDSIQKYKFPEVSKTQWSKNTLQLILHGIINGPKQEHLGIYCPQLHGEKDIKVQLCAIAKDEGAYLSEWIYHHIYFGFDEIKILINDTTDDSIEILEKINTLNPAVTYEVIDHLISKVPDEGDNNDFQIRAYQYAYRQVVKRPNQYMMFLDIDEFWTPDDFNITIKDFLSNLDLPDLVSFEWALKQNESPFSSPFNAELTLVKELAVKSIFKTANKVETIDIHNSVIRSVNNILANGARHPRQYYGIVNMNNQGMPLKKAFITHRIWRSEVEYIAHSFKKSNTNLYYNQVADGVTMKTNRKGFEYSEFKDRIKFKIPNRQLVPYLRGLNDFISESDIEVLIKKCREEVLHRFSVGHQFLSSQKNTDDIQIKEFIRNLSLDRALRSAREYLAELNTYDNQPTLGKTLIDDNEYITRTDFTFLHSTKPETIFIHIMKNGGTSLAKSLGFNNPINPRLVGGKKHHTVLEVIEIIGADKWNDSYKFTFVRNPWARMLSLYRYLERKNELQSRRMKDLINPTFNQWVVRLLNDKDGPYQWTQHDWLVDNDGNVKLSFIGKFEDLKKDYDRLCKTIGVDSPLQKINMSRKNSNSYKEYYDENTAELVSRHFKKDIELFDYQF